MATPWHKTLKEEEKYSDWQELQTENGLTYYFNTTTQETRWEKPAELMSAMEMDYQTNCVWAPDDQDCYIPAFVIGEDEESKELILELLDTGMERRVPARQELIPLQKSSLQRIVADLTLLDEMNIPLILNCLRKRFEAGKIYSAIGTILISINPYKMLNKLYGKKAILKYRDAFESHKDPPPHVYTVADQAYRGLTMPGGRSQSIIISGESGAGKTEAAKQVLSYLGAVAGSVSGIEKKVFDANPILESFGNAKTLRNNNSSRFGKYVEIFFNKDDQLCGGTTTNYLLEKIRVVKQADGERNFHIFYMMCKAPKKIKDMLRIRSPDHYYYLMGGNTKQVPGINDRNWFEEVQEAFSTLEFKKREVESCYKIVSGIMHMGNIEFEEVQSRSQDATSRVVRGQAIKDASQLFGVDPRVLEKAVTITELRVGRQKPVQVPLSPQKALDQRDAICKYIYSQMFDWLVKKINACMVPKDHARKKIGILDIFGFEIFKVNSLEQLMINFTNEKLQQLFNFRVFKEEERVYKTENIQFGNIDYTDNQPILDLIEGGPRSKPRKLPMGILMTLNEEAKTPNGSEQGFISKLVRTHQSSRFFRKSSGPKFVLTHYAGDVTYNVKGFMDKNADTLSPDLLNLVSSSKVKLLSGFVPKSMSSGKRKATLAMQFIKSLSNLMGKLHETQTHYIRCIKPNNEKAELFFVPRNCMEQMTYSGVFEAVKIRKSGFPFRLKHKDFVVRYKCLLEEARKRCNNGVDGCNDIIRFLKFNKDDIRMGRSMVFYRAKQHKLLELKRSIIVEKRKMDSQLRELINTDVGSLEDPEYHYDRLARAIRSCRRYKIDNDLSREAIRLLEKFIEDRMDPETKRQLAEAVDTRNIEMLREVCKIVEQEDYQTKLATQAIRLKDRIELIIEESENAAVTLKTEPMLALVVATDEIDYWSTEQFNDYLAEITPLGFSAEKVFLRQEGAFNSMDVRDAAMSLPQKCYFDQFIGKIRALLQFGVDSQKYMWYQMKAARQCNDIGRQIRLQIKLKKTVFEGVSAQMFIITNAPTLKKGAEFASEKMFSFNKTALAEGMMKWTKDNIHTSLTHLKDRILKKRAYNEMFTSIRIWAGDKPNSTGVDLYTDVANVFAMAVNESQLGDELYLQLIKQLTECRSRSPNVKNKYWELLNVCLFTYPPSEALENYIEYWLRSQQKDTLVVALHTILYNKRKPRAPSPNEIRDIVSSQRRVQSDFLEEPPSVPTWAPLRRPYMEEQDFVEDRPLAGAAMEAPKLANSSRTSNQRKRTMSSMKKKPSIRKLDSGGPPELPISTAPTFGGNKGGGKKGGGKKKAKKKKKPQNNPGGPPMLQPPNKVTSQFPMPSGGPPPSPVMGKPPMNPIMGGSPANPIMGGPPANPIMAGPPANPMMRKPPVNPIMGAAKPSGGIDFRAQLNARIGTGRSDNASKDKSGGKKKKSSNQQFPKPVQPALQASPAEEKSWPKKKKKKKSKPKAKPKEPSPEPIPEPVDEKYDFDYKVHVDPQSGDCYYEDIRTGETMWDKPQGRIKNLWVFHLDPESNDFYYECMNTGETSWDMPNEFQDPDYGWTVQYIESNDSFIYIDNEIAFENEEAAKSTKPPPNWNGPLPASDDWARHWDENSHDFYYENIRTGVTQWEKPPGANFD